MTEPANAWSWEDALKKYSEAASVSVIKHAPLHQFWAQFHMDGACAVVLTEPLLLPEGRSGSDRSVDYLRTFWSVEVVQVAGYYAKVRFLGYPDDHEEAAKNRYWIHMKDLKDVCTYKRKGYTGSPPWPINPESPATVVNRLINSMLGKFSKNPLVECLVEKSLTSHPWKVGKQVETLDKDRISHMRFGYIGKILGRRVSVHYWDSTGVKGKDGYWVHADSDMLKPSGWSATVGATISAPKSVKPALLSQDKLGVTIPDFEIRPLMIFEMVNPISCNELAVGQVIEVLKYGFFKCAIMSPLLEDDLKTYANGKNEFFYHVSSPWIFPIGTAKKYGLKKDLHGAAEVSPNSVPLPIPPKDLDEERFTRGMFVEVVDSNVTELVCPARIIKILGPYAVLVRFIGWSSGYDQWKPIDSLDIFPIGWCELVGYPLESASAGDADVNEELEEENDIMEFAPQPEVPSSSAESVLSNVQKSNQGRSRRKSIPKKLAVEVIELPVKNLPKPRKPSTKRKSRVKDSDESEDEQHPSASIRKARSSRDTKPVVKPREKPTPDGTRKSARARAAPEFFGENVNRRNSRNNYLE